MKTPKPRRVSSGQWYINLRLGGESISITEPTKAACVRAAQLVKAEYLAGKRIRSTQDTATLGEIIDAYILARSRVLSPATVRGYTQIRQNRFQAVMSKSAATVTDWQSIVNQEAGECSPKTLQNAWQLVSSALKAHTGAAPQVQLPQVPRATRPWLTPEQIPVFLEAIQGSPAETGALLALCSLRCSEILGLRWQDVDLSAGTVTVQGSMVRDQADRYVRKDTTKNASSARTVPIMIPRLLELLKAAPPHLPLSPVVEATQQSLYGRINTACRSAGLPEVGIHGLRHSFASLCYRMNVPYKVVMRVGGWSDDATMQRIYTHIADQDVQKATENLSAFFKTQTKTQTKAKKRA